MPAAKRHHRQSISLPPRVARRVKTLAKARRTSTTRVLVQLIEKGLDARAAERERFFALGERLIASKDKKEKKRLREELAILTFGE
ncbi:MAG: hypothetical protein L0Z53_03460 [Acidobacteriales bacterium]|nr:hypothetical protein [Terriglobales bacterium]